MIFATAQGNVRRSHIDDFRNIQANGKIAIRLDNNDKLVAVDFCKENNHILLATKEGKSIRFQLSSLRIIKSRSSSGVRGIKLAKNDEVISQTILNDSDFYTETKSNYLSIPLDVRKKYFSR